MLLNREHGRILLGVSAQAISSATAHLDRAPIDVDAGPYPAELRALRASFVTLHRHGTLRGCRGSILATEPLVVNVAHSARAAAILDERFSPVEPEEVSELELHISVLGAPARLPVESEAELLESLRIGIDGLVIREGSSQALFLPSVWEKLPEPREFVERLKAKAGLPERFWSSTIVCERFTVEDFEGAAVDYLEDEVT